MVLFFWKVLFSAKLFPGVLQRSTILYFLGFIFTSSLENWWTKCCPLPEVRCGKQHLFFLKGQSGIQVERGREMKANTVEDESVSGLGLCDVFFCIDITHSLWWMDSVPGAVMNHFKSRLRSRCQQNQLYYGWLCPSMFTAHASLSERWKVAFSFGSWWSLGTKSVWRSPAPFPQPLQLMCGVTKAGTKKQGFLGRVAHRARLWSLSCVLSSLKLPENRSDVSLRLGLPTVSADYCLFLSQQKP